MATPKFTPRIITGAWRQGYALDLHTLSSEYVGDDEFGHARFNNTYSEVGQLLYQLKSRADKAAIPPLADALGKHLTDWKPPVNLIVPVPPSTRRTVPPVILLAEALSKRTGIPLADCIARKRDIPQLKSQRPRPTQQASRRPAHCRQDRYTG